MKFSAAVGVACGVSALPAFASMASANPNPSSSIDLGGFVLPQSTLLSMAADPPSFASKADSDSTSAGPSVDIVSIGSISRLDFLTAQLDTWASHRGVRHFWGFSELQDLDPECAANSAPEELASFVEGCRAFHSDLDLFFSNHFGETEGGHDRSGDPGWVCAQRRPGRALAWLHQVYVDQAEELPDYLLMVDDDSYVDMPELLVTLQDSQVNQGVAASAGGCVFKAGQL